MRMSRQFSTFHRSLLVLAVGLICVSTPKGRIWAQAAAPTDNAPAGVFIPPSYPCGDKVEVQKSTLDALTASFEKGNWADLSQKLSAVVTSVRTKCGESKLDPKAPYLLSFTDSKLTPTAVLRLTYTAKPSAPKHPNPYSTRLIPAGSVNEPRVFDVHCGIPEEIYTAYNAAPLPIPLGSSLTKFVSDVVGGLGKSAVITPPAIHLMTQEVKGTRTPGTVWCTVTQLEIPKDWKRFSLSVQDKSTDQKSTYSALTTKYAYGPATSWDLGLGAAVPAVTFGNKPAKVDSSKNLVSDPPTGLLTYVALSWHPTPYDETTTDATPAEQRKLFGGIALTPNPGLLFGAAWSPSKLRSISVQVGAGALLSNVLRSSDALGKPPSSSARPTRRGALGVAFLGIGYSL